MKADKLTLQSIFEKTERLEAPLFQRPYVWQREANWLPLWQAISSVAEKRLANAEVRPHFLGTIVLDQLKTPTGKMHARQIIDGQQRLSTLQLLFAAARDLSSGHTEERYSEAFRRLTENEGPLCDEPDDVFKVWPTNADRVDFRKVVKAGSAESVRKLPHADPEDQWLIPDAYLYFSDNVRQWLRADEDDGFSERLRALYLALTQDLHVVVIDLEQDDDPQLIFETLNALGTPLLPADLVKNYLFHLAEAQDLDTRRLYQQHWHVFDVERAYWRKEVRQGRLKRPRLDFFLNHYLTLMMGEDISVAHLFAAYKDFVQRTDRQNAESHMERFRSYADVYRTFDAYPQDSREGVFFYRLDQMDTTTVFPLLLEVFNRYGGDEGDPDELHQILDDLESFLVRRAVCELTTKNYNRLFVDMCKTFQASDDFSANAVRTFLLEQTADTSRWPADEKFRTSWLTVNFYRRLTRRKGRMILETLDAALHTGKTEKVQIERKLQIEHLMPRE